MKTIALIVSVATLSLFVSYAGAKELPSVFELSFDELLNIDVSVASSM